MILFLREACPVLHRSYFCFRRLVTDRAKEGADANGIAPGDYVVHNDEEAMALCAEIEKIDNFILEIKRKYLE